jgi:HlyD family secretion protein
LERAERDARVAEARSRELRERFGFVNAKAREEDVARAEATIRLSQAQVASARAGVIEARARRAEAQARLDKSFIRSPIAGVVLRKRLRTGESVSPESANDSIFTIGDTSALRVRVDVDERDVGGISVGQRVYVTAEAYGARKFTGRVVQIGQVLGRKNVRTEEPTERVDKKILETLVELDAGQRLPPGLRVDAFIVIGEAETAGVTRGWKNDER